MPADRFYREQDRDLDSEIIADLKAEVARLREALAFYADRMDGLGDGYDVQVNDCGLSVSVGHIVKDDGERARAALRGTGNE